jgi:hypothetical protein
MCSHLCRLSAMTASIPYGSEEQHTGLYRHASVAGNVGKRGVGSVELRNPQAELGARSSGRSNVAIVRSDRLVGKIPLEVNLASWVAEGNCPIIGDGWFAGFAANGGIHAGRAVALTRDERVAASGWLVHCLPDPAGTGLIEHTQGGEVLPCETRLGEISDM